MLEQCHIILVAVLLFSCFAVCTALKKGDSCDQPGLACTDDYKLVCASSKTCNCRQYSKFFNNLCVAGRLSNPCDDGKDPVGCGQFPGAVCVQSSGTCECPANYTFDQQTRDSCGLGLSSFRGTCGTSDDCSRLPGALCTGGYCSCSVGQMVSFYDNTKCEAVLGYDCTVFPIFEKCKDVGQASCKIINGVAKCTCDAGYVPQNNLCVKSDQALVQVVAATASYGLPCKVLGAACDTGMTLFCTRFDDGNLKCGCQIGMIAPTAATGACTPDPSATDTCSAIQVPVQGKCDTVFGKPCNVAAVTKKCKMDKASCTVPPGLITPVCMCPTGFQPSDTDDSCVTAKATPPGGIATSNSSDANKIGKGDAAGGGGNTGIIIGVVVGLLLLLALMAAYFVLKKKKPEEEEEEEEEGSGATGEEEE